MWARESELSLVDAAAVIAHYPPGVDPAGFDYSRPTDDPRPARTPVRGRWPARPEGAAVNAPGEHPSWCDKNGCQGRGWHASARLLVHPDAHTTGPDLRADQPAAAVRLVQLLVSDAEPFVVLTGARTLIGDGDEGPGLLLSIRQSRIRFVLRLVEMAETR